jgi:plasmid stabilization system protein ParE
VRIRVTRRADAHIEQAAVWWEQNRPLSPGALNEELAEAFALLISQPAIGAPASNARSWQSASCLWLAALLRL